MIFKHLIFVLFLLFFTLHSFSQELAEAIPENELDPMQNRMDWIPVMLNARSDVLLNAVTFNGGVFSWKLRGGQTNATYIDGIHWSIAHGNWKSNDLFLGLQNSLRTEAIIVNDAFSDIRYFNTGTLFYKSSFPFDVKKSWSTQTTISNRTYGNAFNLNYNSGWILNKWRYRMAGFAQWMPPATVAIGYKKSAGFLYSAERKISNTKTLQFSFTWNLNDQSKESTTVKEVYMLSGQRGYQSNWGWYHQSYFFPSTKQNNTAVLSLQYHKRIAEYQYLQFNNAIAIGKQGQTSLAWNNTADPRPDYYRYLPSYHQDSALKLQLNNWLIQHPSQLQIQFDAMEKINKASIDHRSYYMVNQHWNQFFSWQGAFQISSPLFQNWNAKIGADYGLDYVRQYDQVKDLLGGAYYLNYNNWINEDGNTFSFQNDILHPDRKLVEGERWGADYALLTAAIQPWMQINKQGPRFEFYYGMGIGVLGFQRIGFNKNGLVANSKGVSVFKIYPNWDFKTQWLYKYSGRLYARAILTLNSSGLSSETYFLQPEISEIKNPYAIAVQGMGADFSIIYQAPDIKWRATAYWKSKHNDAIQKMFYHDAFASFVYGLAGEIQTHSKGLEASVETALFSKIQLSWVGNLQQNIYVQNIPYQLLFLNDLHVMEEGILFVKNLPSSNSPSWMQTLSLVYNPYYTWKVGLHYVFAYQRPVSIDLFRRSSWVKSKLDALSWEHLWHNPALENQGVMNLFLSKSFQQKSKIRTLNWYTSISVRNLFNSWIPVFAYEQSRFDYLHFKANKYDLKYLMDKGASFSLSIQLQIQ